MTAEHIGAGDAATETGSGDLCRVDAVVVEQPAHHRATGRGRPVRRGRRCRYRWRRESPAWLLRRGGRGRGSWRRGSWRRGSGSWGRGTGAAGVGAARERVQVRALAHVRQRAPGAAAAASAGAAAPAPSALTTARTVPTSTVSPSWTRISARRPAAGDGTSESTLSVETSKSGSSRATASPTYLSHLVTVPSVTVSPSWGIVTSANV